ELRISVCGNRQFIAKDAGVLGHCVDLRQVGHHRVTGEMSLKECLVNGDGFHADAFGFGFEANNAIDHEKWETMRQNLHHFISIESSVAARDCSRRGDGTSARLLASD